MKISDARKIGLFGRRVYVGQFFLDKTEDDFKTREEYLAYAEQHRRDEYIDLREPSNAEIETIQKSYIDERHYLDAPEELRIERFKEYELRKDDLAKASTKLTLDCIVGSSFVDEGGKPCSKEEIRELVTSRVSISTELASEFGAMAKGFQKQSEEN